MTSTWDCQQTDPARLLDWAQARLAGAKSVEAVTRPGGDSLEVRSAVIPGWAIVLAIFLFPIGLLFLLARTRAVLSVRAEPHEAGTRLHIVGGTTPGVRKELAAMWHELFPAAA